MNKSMQQLAAAAMIAASALAFTATPAYAQNEGQVLVDKADTTLSNFLRDPEMKWLQQNIGKARGVLIVHVVSAAPADTPATDATVAPAASRITKS